MVAFASDVMVVSSIFEIFVIRFFWVLPEGNLRNLEEGVHK